MTGPAPAAGESDFDPEVVRAKYLAERDRRLVPTRTAIRDLDNDERCAAVRDDPFSPVTERGAIVEDADVVIVGGGIAGILAGVRLREAGVQRIRVVDRAGGFGGTWYWNRYPGAMCDVESYIYLPMLEELGYVPRDRYASGEEIRHHLEAIATRFDLVDDALFHTGITGATWDEDRARWIVTTDRGDVIAARYYVLAVGILNLLKLPAIDGMDEFVGPSFHTARWNYDVTGGGPDAPMTRLRDRTVALIGTGATGIQCVTPLADAARHVYVFQRTPSAIGRRDNRPTDPEFAASLEPGWQAARSANFERVMMGRPVEQDLVDDGWTRHYVLVRHPPRTEGMSIAEYLHNAEVIDYQIMEEHRRRIDETVDDPVTAERLKPYYRYLCKRPCFHDEYLGAFNRPNVTLVDCPAGIDRMTERGLVVGDQAYDVDVVVYGTGFEPEITPLSRRAGHEIVGRGGVRLSEKFATGPRTLFGMLSRGFPNLFVMPSPAHQAVVPVNYTHGAVIGAAFVGGAVAVLERIGARSFDVSAEAEERWVQHVVDSYVDATEVMSACTPSRINQEGDPSSFNPLNGNYGRGFGDCFRYQALLEEWVATGDCDGLELDVADRADE